MKDKNFYYLFTLEMLLKNVLSWIATGLESQSRFFRKF